MIGRRINSLFEKDALIGNSIPVDNRYFQPSKNRTDYSCDEFANGKDDIWIRFDLFKDVINSFYSSQFNNSPDMKGTFLNIDDAWCVAHPNIKSLDGNILLIPNIFAYKGLPNIDKYKGISTSGQTGTDADSTLNLVLQNSYRDDHNKILNGTKATQKTSFPYYGPIDGSPDGCNGYAGQLKNLFVKLDFIKSEIESAKDLEELLNNVLRKMSNSVGNIWNFDIRQNSDKSGGNSTYITILDLNFVGFTPLSKLKTSSSRDINSPLYTFESSTKNSIFLSYSSTMKITDAVVANLLYSNMTNNASGISTNNFTGNNRNGDLVIAVNSPEQIQDVNKTTSSREISNKFFYMKNKIGDSFQHTYLAEEDAGVLTKLMQDSNNLNANKIGMIPNQEITFELLGISGIKFYDGFLINPIPKLYKNCMFQVKKISYDINDSQWITKIVAGVRPAN